MPRLGQLLRLDPQHVLERGIDVAGARGGRQQLSDHLIAPSPADIRPQRLTPPVRKVLRVVQILDRRQLLLSRGIANPQRGVRVHGPDRQVLGHPLDEPQRQTIGAGPSGRVIRSRRHVELKRMHELVADHVVRVGERTGERQHDASLQWLGHAARAFANLAADDVGLLEVGMRSVQDERLPAAQLVLEQPLAAGLSSAQPSVPRCPPRPARLDRSRCRSDRSEGPGNRRSDSEPCSGRSTEPMRARSDRTSRAAPGG